MKPSTWPLALTMACLLAAPARADQAQLWKDKRCNACHAIERKLIGPAFRDIAARYAGSPAMVEPLATKIRHGGAGAWGAVPMTANPQVSEAEARTLARWVLELRP
ncbi:MAG: hypothetical protein RJA36_1291 [Pseudomonadota bacterium]|jgi:cytochrome c